MLDPRKLSLLFLFVCSTLFAQINVDMKVVIETTESEKIGNFTVVPDNFVATPFRIAVLSWKTAVNREDIAIKVTDEKRRSVPYVTVNDSTIIVTQPGHTWVEVEGSTIDFDLKKSWKIREAVDFTLEPLTPPKPPEPPTPEVPADSFGNIGQRVAEWSKSLPSRKLVGEAYLRNAVLLTSADGRNMTIDDVTKRLGTELLTIPDYPKFATVTSNINLDLATRWPVSKGVLSDYYRCIALGLGVK